MSGTALAVKPAGKGNVGSVQAAANPTANPGAHLALVKSYTPKSRKENVWGAPLELPPIGPKVVTGFRMEDGDKMPPLAPFRMEEPAQKSGDGDFRMNKPQKRIVTEFQMVAAEPLIDTGFRMKV